MKSWHIFLVIVAISTVLNSQDKPATQSRPAAAKEKLSLRFHWPIHSKVTVVEKELRGGKKFKSRYQAQLVKDGENYRLKLTDRTFITIAGQDAKDPRYARILAPIKALKQAFPDLRVAKDGSSLGTVDIDRTIQQLLEQFEKLPANEIEKDQKMAILENMRVLIKAPSFKAAMEESAEARWSVWVAAWAGKKLAIGEGQDFDVALPIPGGGKGVKKWKFTNHGKAPFVRGFVKLSAEMTIQGKEARKVLPKIMKGLSAVIPRLQGKRLDPDKMFKHFWIRTRIEVVTRPDGLRPRTALMEKTISIHVNGEARPRVQVERREYSFLWEN